MGWLSFHYVVGLRKVFPSSWMSITSESIIKNRGFERCLRFNGQSLAQEPHMNHSENLGPHRAATDFFNHFAWKKWPDIWSEVWFLRLYGTYMSHIFSDHLQTQHLDISGGLSEIDSNIEVSAYLPPKKHRVSSSVSTCFHMSTTKACVSFQGFFQRILSRRLG